MTWKIERVNTFRPFLICITYPDTDHILIPGVNGVFFSNASCLYFPEGGWLYCNKIIIYVFSKINAFVFSRFVHAFHKRAVFFTLLLVSRSSPFLSFVKTVTLIPDLLPCWWEKNKRRLHAWQKHSVLLFYLLFSNQTVHLQKHTHFPIRSTLMTGFLFLILTFNTKYIGLWMRKNTFILWSLSTINYLRYNTQVHLSPLVT